MYSGGKLIVSSGGAASSTTVQSGGSLSIGSGGTDSATTILSGGTETVSSGGTATGDQISGTLTIISTGATAVSNETVYSGGSLNISKSATVSNTTLISGGTVDLLTGAATLAGTLTFSGGSNTLKVASVVNTVGTIGDLAPISGFSSTDKIDITALTSAVTTLSQVVSGGNTVAEIISGSSTVETFIFSGTAISGNLTLVADGSGDAEIIYSPPVSSGGTTTSVTTSTASGAYTESTGNTLLVLNGGSVSAATIDNGAFLVVSGGTDYAATVSAGGTETVSTGSATRDQIYGGATVDAGANVSSETVQNGGTLLVSNGAVDSASTVLAGGTETVLGSASGDQIYGTQLVSAATAAVTNETVQNGGNLDLFLAGATATGTTVLHGGTLAISSAATASNTVLSGGGTVKLESPKATLAGSLTFSGGGNTLDLVSIVTTSAGYGEQAVISGFSSTDKIDVSVFGTGASASYSTSGGNEVVTVSGGGSTETFIFAGTSTYTSNTMNLASAGSVVDLEYDSAGFVTSVTSATSSAVYTESAGYTLLVLNGGSVSAPTIDNGAFLIVNGGADYAATVLAGGSETVSAGSASGDQIYGTQLVNGTTAAVANETVQEGGTLALGGASTATNTTLIGGGTVELASPTATLSGSLTFADGGNTLDIAAIASGGDGDQAVISGFSSADKIVLSGVGAGAALSFSTSGGNEVVTVSGGSDAETLIFAGTSIYTSNTLSLVTSGGAVDLETSFAASDFNIQPYDASTASTISAGPLALYAVPVDQIAPTQMNEGFTEVDAKAAAFDLFTTSTALESDLIGDIEPVVIGPGGQLYLLDGHHTFTALIDSIWGASDPTVYVNVIANYSADTEAQFFAQMQANNWLLPLNNGVPQTVTDATGAPIPTSLTGLTSDVYRGLEYSILKQKDSKLFTSSSNISGATGASTPGLDKMTGIYSDFAEAAAYQDADGGLGLPYLSPGDIAIATQWNLNPLSTTTLPNVSGTVYAYQLPGFILSQNVAISASISNATLGQTVFDGAVVPGSMEGAIDGNGTFTGITQINAGTTQNPIYIDTPNIGFIMQVGADKGFTVTLSNTANTYVGGTTFLAGTLVIAGDRSLSAAPGETNTQFLASLTFDAEGFPGNVTAAVQADNGIIFNSLSEGNGTLTIGTTAGAFTGTSPFTTSRPIAVGNEAATINVNGSYVELEGQLVTLPYDNLGLGYTGGFPAFTIDDLSSGGGSTPTAGTLILSTPSPYFYGDIIIGNKGTPTVEVMSDAALGNTTGPAAEIGEVELNGGTLQTGASFAAPERDINLEGGSQIDLDGNTTTWGTLTDVKRTIAIGNSSATAGAITFSSFTISQTSILQLDGSANGTTYTGNETVTFTNGINQTAAQDTLVLDASSPTALGTTEQVFSNGASSQLIDGIAPVWIVTNEGNASGDGPYDFVTYGANGYVQESANSSTLSASTGSTVVELSANATVSSDVAAYALNTNGFTITLSSSDTLTIGDGTDDAGLILGSAISGGTLAFATSQGVIWLDGSNPTISSQITGSDGLTFAGSGSVTLSTAANVTGVITIDSGTVTLSAVDVFANDVAGIELGDVKTHPAPSTLDLTASNAFTTLNSVGSKSAINIGSGDTLTIGDTTNNLSSTLSSTIKNASNTAPAIITAGSGLVDLSGATITLVAGSAIDVTGGQLRVATGALTNTATAGSAPNFVLSNNAQLQFAQSEGQYAGSISGAGSLNLVTGTLQLTGANSYTGNTILTTGTTLDVTTANLPTGNDISTTSGSLVDFDQTTTGAFGGVISGTGSLDKDDSTTNDAGNVTLTAVQTYTGATYVEAGTLTLGVANAVADSSGVTLGRVGGGATATLALSANNTLASLSSDASNTTTVDLNGNVLTLDPTSTNTSSFGGTIGDGSGTGSVVVDGAGTVTLSGQNTFSGGITIDAGTLELGNADAAGTGAITFANDPTLEIDGTTMPTNTIDGFISGDAIDLTSIANVAGSHADMNYSTRVLTITEGSNTYTLNFNPAESFAGDYFHLAADAAGTGTEITENTTPCYCRGTLIRTDRGDVPVEELAIGDAVTTALGKLRPIKWIGRRSYGGRFVMGRKDILPICIKAGALDDNVPCRDLWISPHHAMYLEGVLIEARDLVNGASIVQAERVEKVEYFHIELEEHDVIIAEGALSESFVDDDSRLMFHNAHEYRVLYPDNLAPLARYFAPRCSDGHAVEAARRHVAVRAGLNTPERQVQTGALRGYVDVVRPDRIAGWAQNTDYPDAPVCLDIYANGRLIGQTLANCYRADLENAGIGGRHGFAFTPPAGTAFAAATVEVRRSLDGATLPATATVRGASVRLAG